LGLYSIHATAAFEPEPAAIWRHDSVVEAAMREGAVLPTRFGTTFSDLPGLVDALERDQDRLSRRLEDVRGCVELAVRVSVPSASDGAPRSGAEYVRGQLAREQERRTVAEQTLVPLEAHALRSSRSSVISPSGELTASYLVRAEAVDGFADQVEALAHRHSELALSCTGPWPPYSFVGGAE
jgi:hypothetical protein